MKNQGLHSPVNLGRSTKNHPNRSMWNILAKASLVSFPIRPAPKPKTKISTKALLEWTHQGSIDAEIPFFIGNLNVNSWGIFRIEVDGSTCDNLTNPNVQAILLESVFLKKTHQKTVRCSVCLLWFA